MNHLAKQRQPEEDRNQRNVSDDDYIHPAGSRLHCRQAISCASCRSPPSLSRGKQSGTLRKQRFQATYLAIELREPSQRSTRINARKARSN
jgi:hypothetical protein